jgi:rubrerythrin
MNAINYLTRFETDCLDLYAVISQATDDPEKKGLYSLLTDARQRHLDRLLAMGENLPSDAAESAIVDRAGQVMNVCRQTLLSPDIMKAMRNDHDAFDHIVHAEEEMIKLCTGMARSEDHAAVKQLLNWFVEDEKKHLEEIEGIYDFVESPHCYLEWGEFSNMRTL